MKGIWFILILAIIAACTQKSNEVKYADLVDRMVDLKRLAVIPEEGETSGMFSSYDRRSKYDEATDTYVEWSANNDGFSPQYIRKEGENMVLAEMDGPGAIVRIWSASPREGHVKVYIDGNEVPIIDMPFIDYFNTEKLPAFAYPELVYETNARGFNNYIPITFQKSIKIVGEPEWGQYYHFNYITFPSGTTVEKFETIPTESAKEALENINTYFENGLGETSRYTAGSTEESEKITLAPGEEKTVFQLKGKQAITAIKVRLPETMQTPELMRKTTLSIYWNNEKNPSVWSPLGDFFGSAPGFNTYHTLPMGMLENGEMYSNWYMPFEEAAEIRITNNNEVPVEIELKVNRERNRMKTDEFAYFHAKWHRDLAPLDSTRWPDWTVLQTTGKGRFVGMFLQVWNPKGGHCVQYAGEGQHWWGEGDEKFFVDGEKFPSTFGTGTEDYFGYAWCIPNYFERAFHSQNYTDQNMGYQSLTRWQIIDNVPFQQSFEAYLEKYFPNHWPTQYATVAYWYLHKNGEDLNQPVSPDELFGYENEYEVYDAGDVIEGEEFDIVENTGGWAGTDVFAHESLYPEISRHKVLSWSAAEGKENELTVNIDPGKSRNYRLVVNAICLKGGGTFRISINGKKLKEFNTFYDSDNQKAQKFDLGTINLKEGQEKMIIEWTGKNDEGRRLFLDYVGFEPLK
ncbi:glycoside hydrolase family 172 protein [Maribellus mangrovi]|uniref:glycoside hydrolase family 172 protein n=1 Tax=Maribellus mangrovi TaxID=3133146 RepID=UPI0030ED9D6B